jgi:hypothetical protein
MIHSIFSTRKQKIEMGKEIAIIAAVRCHGYIGEIESLYSILYIEKRITCVCDHPSGRSLICPFGEQFFGLYFYLFFSEGLADGPVKIKHITGLYIIRSLNVIIRGNIICVALLP